MANIIHVKKGDQVVVISGKSKGEEGKVIAVDNKKGRVYVEGVNMVKKHQKARTQNAPAGIIEREGSIDASNVMYYDTKAKQASRVGYKVKEDGTKSRVFVKTGKTID